MWVYRMSITYFKKQISRLLVISELFKPIKSYNIIVVFYTHIGTNGTIYYYLLTLQYYVVIFIETFNCFRDKRKHI